MTTFSQKGVRTKLAFDTKYCCTNDGGFGWQRCKAKQARHFFCKLVALPKTYQAYSSSRRTGKVFVCLEAGVEVLGVGGSAVAIAVPAILLGSSPYFTMFVFLFFVWLESIDFSLSWSL